MTIKMTINKNLSTSPGQALSQGRHSDTEKEYKQLLTLHKKSGKLGDMRVVTWLQSLAQALEGQSKYAEGLEIRLRARDMLISLMGTV